MRFATPMVVALVVLTVCVAPITAQQTTTECGPTTGDGMTNETMANGTTGMMDDGTTGMMGNESMNETTQMMGNESMGEMANGTTESMAGDSMNESMGNESMSGTTEMMGNESMNETTRTMNDSMDSETTTCDSMGDDSMGDDSMDDGEMSDTTTESMGESMNDTTDAPEAGSSAFTPGFGVFAAVAALGAALYVARRRP